MQRRTACRVFFRFFRASPQQNVSSLCSIEMTRLLRHPRYARPVAAKLADNKTAWERHWRVLLLRHPRYARPVAAILADNKTTWERHWRVLQLRHPRYARPMAAKLADNKTAWERHWHVLLLRHPHYARPVAAILADNKTAFCHSRTLCEESLCIQMPRMRST